MKRKINQKELQDKKFRKAELEENFSKEEEVEENQEEQDEEYEIEEEKERKSKISELLTSGKINFDFLQDLEEEEQDEEIEDEEDEVPTITDKTSAFDLLNNSKFDLRIINPAVLKLLSATYFSFTTKYLEENRINKEAIATFMLDVFSCAFTIKNDVIKTELDILEHESGKMRICIQPVQRSENDKAYYTAEEDMIVFYLKPQDLMDDPKVRDEYVASFVHEGFHKINNLIVKKNGESPIKQAQLEGTVKEIRGKDLIKKIDSEMRELAKKGKEDNEIVNLLTSEYPYSLLNIARSSNDIDMYDDREHDEMRARVIECLCFDELKAQAGQINKIAPDTIQFILEKILPIMNEIASDQNKEKKDKKEDKAFQTPSSLIIPKEVVKPNIPQNQNSVS